MEDHFKKLFMFDGHRDWSDILSCLDLVVTDEMNEILCSPISDLEIKEAVFNMGGSKAHGLDGF